MFASLTPVAHIVLGVSSYHAGALIDLESFLICIGPPNLAVSDYNRRDN